MFSLFSALVLVHSRFPTSFELADYTPVHSRFPSSLNDLRTSLWRPAPPPTTHPEEKTFALSSSTNIVKSLNCLHYSMTQCLPCRACTTTICVWCFHQFTSCCLSIQQIDTKSQDRYPLCLMSPPTLIGFLRVRNSNSLTCWFYPAHDDHSK